MDYTLRVLGSSANDLGDTLTRLSTDFFHTLGYENCRLNVHKTGRELDVEGEHVFEPRRVVAECKAHQTPVGGADLNKFAGVLDMERRKNAGLTIHGYFISLSGYRESAIEQERDVGSGRFEMIDGLGVVQRLIDADVVVSPTKAAALAGQACKHVSHPLVPVGPMNMLATTDGWVWAITFAVSGIKTHVAYVHADGTLLQNPPSGDIPEDLQLTLLAPPPDLSREEVYTAYREYLLDECGVITLEGMPADQDVGLRGFKLEDMYVPLELEEVESEDLPGGAREDHAENVDNALEATKDDVDVEEVSDEAAHEETPGEPLSLGQALTAHKMIAILGPPGAGKSTLIKRIAVAFADPSRQAAVEDGLHGGTLFPVLIRCRHLGDLATAPFAAIFSSIMTRAEKGHLADSFVEAVQSQLRAGNLLLLIDGLDEISKTSERVAFLQQLRTFVSRYPRLRLVMTSRETGYRDVAGPVRSIADCFRVCELDSASISALVEAWHVEVLGDTLASRQEALDLTASILSSDRVRRLAVNPLLLTTLLLVKRWVGQLPRRRSVLYQKAVEVLLMTWNVEGHEPLDQEEALPQLAFAAYEMMKRGVSSVDAIELGEIFTRARVDMPEILGYTKDSVAQFVARVEERSSLLTLSGHRVSAGRLTAIYEFKHLTFQEYLAASAIINGWLPASERNKTSGELIEPFIDQPRWREVVSLTAVLAGRNGVTIVELLIAKLQALTPEWDSGDEPQVKRKIPRRVIQSVIDSLVQCLADEVQIAPLVAEKAMRAVIDAGPHGGITGLVASLRGGRYYGLLEEVAMSGLVEVGPRVSAYGSMVATLVDRDVEGQNALDVIEEWLDEPASSAVQLKAAGLLMRFLFGWVHPSPYVDDRPHHDFDVHRLKSLTERVAKEGLVDASLPRSLLFMRMWVLAWGGHLLQNIPVVNKLQSDLIHVWREDENRDLRSFAAWALSSLPLLGSWHVQDRQGLIQHAERAWSETYRAHDHQAAALVICVYLGAPWRETEVLSRLKERPRVFRDEIFEKRIRRRLGLPPGRPLRRRAVD